MKKINFAVIGFGYWGPHLTRNLAKISDINIAYICDVNKQNLLKAAKLYPATKTLLNYREILKDQNLDAVIIATPPGSHYRISEDVLRAGKHLLVEKPFTEKVQEGEKLIALAKKVNKTLMVSFPFIYSEAVTKIKELLEQNKLGNVYYYDSIRINLSKVQKDTDVIADLAVHDFSILQYLFKNKPHTISSTGSSFVSKKQAELAHIYIKYESGLTAHIHLSWLSPLKIRSIMIGGSKRMLTYNDVEPSEKVRVFDRGVNLSKRTITPFAPLYRTGDITIPYLLQNEPLENELNHFVQCIRSNTSPRSSGKNALEVMRMVECAQTSLKEKKEVKFS